MRFERHACRTGGTRRYFRVGQTLYPSLGSFLHWKMLDTVMTVAQVYRERNTALGGCERCGSFWRLELRGPWTCYPWDGEGENPNRSMRLCAPCGDDADDYWDEMWAEYRHSQGY